MTIRLSTGMRDAINNGGVTGGVKGALALGFIWLYDGTQPATADTGATGNLLGKVTVNDGGTGLTFDASVAGVLTKAAAETWRFHGLMNGTVGWYRFAEASDTPTGTSATAKRIDGLVGTAGADMNISNTAIVLGAVSTVDTFSFTMPAV
jgi:hypothetical protein